MFYKNQGGIKTVSSLYYKNNGVVKGVKEMFYKNNGKIYKVFGTEDNGGDGGGSGTNENRIKMTLHGDG